MQEPTCLQAEGDNYDPGCAYSFWAILTFFTGCLAIAMYFSGESFSSLMRSGFRSVFAVLCIIGGVIHAASYLARTRVRITATTAGITLEEFCRGKKSRIDIPIDEIVRVHHHGRGISIETERTSFQVRRLTKGDPDVFWLKLDQFVSRHGKTGIMERNLRISQATRNIPLRPRQQQESLPEQQIPLMPVTYQDGVPILPQRLTDEQANGVFQPFQAEPDPQFDLGEEEPTYGKAGDL